MTTQHTAKKNTDVQLICNTTDFVSSNGLRSERLTGNFTWLHGSAQTVLQIETGASSSVLTIRNLSDGDAGQYTCLFSYKPTNNRSVIWTINATRNVGELQNS